MSGNLRTVIMIIAVVVLTLLIVTLGFNFYKTGKSTAQS